MHFFRLPALPPSYEECQVIVWSSIILFAILGMAGFYLAWNPPAEKLEEALELRRYCWISWSLAAGIFGLRRLVI